MADIVTIVVQDSVSPLAIVSGDAQLGITVQDDSQGYLPLIVLDGAPGPQGKPAYQDFCMFVPGSPLPSELILRLIFKSPIHISQAASACSADNAATADTTFTLSNNGVGIGTVFFAAGSSVGVITITNGAFADGDIFRLVAPATPDTTLAFVSFTFKGVTP